VSIESKFISPASYGDAIDIDTHFAQWRGKSFVLKHHIRCGKRSLVEASEVRIFACRVDGDRYRIGAVPAPPEWPALCE